MIDEFNETTCQICNENFKSNSTLNRHLKVHNITLHDYITEWKYHGDTPLCKCGCGKRTNWNAASHDYARYLSSHQAKGRKKSEDEKRRIGEKNRENMRRYMREHPEICAARNKQMLAGRTDETEKRRVETLHHTYATMTPEEKQKFSEHSKELWKSGIMAEARIKAAETFKQRSASGKYDFTERNQKLSDAIAKKYVDGSWHFAKGFYESTKTGKSCYYRSSWELRLMQELDSDPDVLEWESEFTSIPYNYNGAVHKYVPDFHVTKKNDEHILIEVKPQALRETVRNRAKREVAEKFCAERGWKYMERDYPVEQSSISS
jgi:hypothetical protein